MFLPYSTDVIGLVPSVAVLVCTVRALKMHGGGPTVTPGMTHLHFCFPLSASLLCFSSFHIPLSLVLSANQTIMINSLILMIKCCRHAAADRIQTRGDGCVDV